MSRRRARIAPALVAPALAAPALAGVVLSGALLSGCTFSSGSTTEVTESGGRGASAPSGGGAVDQKPAQPTPSVPHVSELCDDLTAVYLTNLSDQEDAASLITDWVRVTAAAPASLKDDLNVVGAYLVAAAKNDFAALKRSSGQVGDALDHIDRYVAKTCRA